MIELRNVTKEYGKGEARNIALKNIDLVIEQGEMVAIIGPSGSGKTTLLNILGCIDSVTTGRYYINGSNVSKCSDRELAVLRNREFGFVTQDFSLINEYTVFQNVCLPIKYSAKMKRHEQKQLILQSLERFGISDKVNAYPNMLSGGQKQRVAIARALINNPNIILADEPTGALDQKNGQLIVELLEEIHRCGKTVIIVTHDLSIARCADRIIKLVDGEIKENGS